MSIPILKQGSYLIASIQSAPSDTDWKELRQLLSQRVVKFRSRGVIVDVTVLDVMDSFAARTLREIAQMVKLGSRRSLFPWFNWGLRLAMLKPPSIWRKEPLCWISP
jgi:rsbT antagonist protein RsbS